MLEKRNYFFQEQYFILAIILTSFACSFYYKNYYILLINVLMFFVIKIKPFEWKKWFFIIFFILLILLFCFLVDEKTKMRNIISWIENKIEITPRKILFNFFDKKYTNEISNSFLKMLIFNQKSKSDWLSNIYNINIAHLFIVSGLHLNIFVFIFEKIFKSEKLRSFRIISIIIFLLIYGYFLNFNVGFLRVFIIYLLNLKKKKISKNDSISISVLIIALFGFYNVVEFSFIISYLCLYTINLINSFKMENTFLKTVIIGCAISFFSFPFSFYFSNKINVLGIIFAYIFGFPIIFLYQFVFWLMLIPKFEIILDFLVNKIDFIIKNINQIDSYIYISEWSKQFIWIYFLGYSTLFFDFITKKCNFF